MPSKPRKPAATKDTTPAVVTPLHEMAPRDRARTILKIDETKVKLQALAKESVTIKSADGKDNYDATHAARMKLKNTRIAIQKTSKEARDDAVKFGKEVITVEKELIGLIEPEEERLQKLQDDADAAIEAERAAAARREQERRAAIGARIMAMQTAPIGMMGKSSADIEAKIEWLVEEDDETFEGEDLDRAQVAKRTSLFQLRLMLDEARTRENKAAEDARIQAEQQERLKRIAAAQAELAEKAAMLEAKERELAAKAAPVEEQKVVEEVLRETGDTLATADVPPKAQDPVRGHELPAAPATNRLNVPAAPMERVHEVSRADIESDLKQAIVDVIHLIGRLISGADRQKEIVALRASANTYFDTEEF